MRMFNYYFLHIASIATNGKTNKIDAPNNRKMIGVKANASSTKGKNGSESTNNGPPIITIKGDNSINIGVTIIATRIRSEITITDTITPTTKRIAPTITSTNGTTTSINKMLGNDSMNTIIKNGPKINKPPNTNIIATSSMTTSTAPTLPPTTARAIKIRSIVRGMIFQMSQVGHRKIESGRNRKLSIASMGKGTK